MICAKPTPIVPVPPIFKMGPIRPPSHTVLNNQSDIFGIIIYFLPPLQYFLKYALKLGKDSW